MDLFNENAEIVSIAKLSECRTYRYTLTRSWDKSLPKAVLIGLNPSTADETKTDPTTTRIIDFMKRNGYGGFILANLFAYRSPYPEDMKDVKDLQGNNDEEVIWLMARVNSMLIKDVIFCWGAFQVRSLYPQFEERTKLMCQMFPEALCFGLTKGGQPRHPLFLAKETKLIKYKTP